MTLDDDLENLPHARQILDARQSCTTTKREGLLTWPAPPQKSTNVLERPSLTACSSVRIRAAQHLTMFSTCEANLDVQLHREISLSLSLSLYFLLLLFSVYSLEGDAGRNIDQGTTGV